MTNPFETGAIAPPQPGGMPGAPPQAPAPGMPVPQYAPQAPQAPQQYAPQAPQAPQQYAPPQVPQAPQQYAPPQAPQAPQQYAPPQAPQAPQQYAPPQAPQFQAPGPPPQQPVAPPAAAQTPSMPQFQAPVAPPQQAAPQFAPQQYAAPTYAPPVYTPPQPGAPAAPQAPQFAAPQQPAYQQPAVAAAGGAPQLGGVQSVQSQDPYSIATPSGVSGTRLSEEGIINQLLMVEPQEYIDSMTTSANPGKPTDAVRAHILPLTGPRAHQLIQDVLIFQDNPKRELQKMRGGANRWLLTFLTLGQAKGGKNAPYLFLPPDENMTAIYQQYVNSQLAAAPR